MRVLTLNFIFLFFVSVHRDTGNQFFQGLPPCTMAYSEDHDNQIDIILRGDVEAMHCVTHVHIPLQAITLPSITLVGQEII